MKSQTFLLIFVATVLTVYNSLLRPADIFHGQAIICFVNLQQIHETEDWHNTVVRERAQSILWKKKQLALNILSTI